MAFLGLATSFWAEFLVARSRIGGSDGKPRRRRDVEAYRSQVPPLSVPLRLRGNLLLLRRQQLKQEGRGWILREKAEIKLRTTCNVQLLFEGEDEEEQKVTDSRLRNTQHSTFNLEWAQIGDGPR